MSDYFRYSNMMVEEAIVLTFPFADELQAGVTLTGTPTVSVAVIGGSGVDATPSGFVVSKQISGSNVLVAIDAQAADVDYELRVTCATTDSSTRLTRVGRILVK